MYSEKLTSAEQSASCSLTLNRYREEDYLMLSGIQHFAFCRRQWALIHIEQQWNENLRTVEGAIFHKKAHDGYSAEKRKDVIISRGMPVFSPSIGISGVCDIVEFHRDDRRGVSLHGREGRYLVYPVEYKKGQPKEDEVDVLQLAAQAMCLEEMLECEITKGYLYYGEIRRRILDGENVVVLSDKQEVGRVPLHNLEAIMTFGFTGASPALMGACAKRNVALSFLSQSGRFLARVSDGFWNGQRGIMGCAWMWRS